MIWILFSLARRRGLGGVGGGGGGGGRVGPLPRGVGGRDCGSSCFFTHLPPHFPSSPFPTFPPPLPGFSGRRAGSLPLPEEPLTLLLPLFRPVGKTNKTSVRQGRKPSPSRGLHPGFGVALRAPRARFAASVPGLPPRRPSLLPVSKMPKSCVSVHPRPRRSLVGR